MLSHSFVTVFYYITGDIIQVIIIKWFIYSVPSVYQSWEARGTQGDKVPFEELTFHRKEIIRKCGRRDTDGWGAERCYVHCVDRHLSIVWTYVHCVDRVAASVGLGCHSKVPQTTRVNRPPVLETRNQRSKCWQVRLLLSFVRENLFLICPSLLRVCWQHLAFLGRWKQPPQSLSSS